MAGSLKGIVIEIGGDTTKLGNALEGVNKHTRSLQSELKGVEKLLKMNPGNTELLAQKQQLLTEAIAETTQKLNTLKGAQEEVQKKWEAYGEAKPQLEALAKEIADMENQLISREWGVEGMEVPQHVCCICLPEADCYRRHFLYL